MKITLSTDEAGYVSQQCPNCERRFKVKFGEGSSEQISFCPYCDHSGRSCWWTSEQAEYFSAKAAEVLIFPEFEKLAKGLSFAGGGPLTIKTKLNKPPAARMPTEPEEEWPFMHFDCCGETIRHDGQNDSFYCVICGVDTNDVGKF